MRQIHRIAPLPLLVATAAALPAVASADRAPIRSERVELRTAVVRSSLVPKSVRNGRFKLVRPRISTRGRWALSTITPVDAGARKLDAVLGLFQSRGSRWRLVEVGTALVGCGKLIVPRDVRRDLGIRCSA
ncbi:hypothetical protein Q5424_24745 [Conexibacter sp. JD483]|uniref:hypothetical protein n=1 Tax=unclassified Conexibacter TaxID=2627773 RepID=UPI00272623D8|nr:MULTISPECIES: hypothetical protein [unclassified Conexibacter]MDO8189324.1 hypothetical protein [Conexibacter sp. CPCC 205706]MDO8201611.1 hypothetical protein [Conexibacter sp. CPCC 205762]MDR9372331.1 hypothetical protein [Conexibacter sp. JD483]